LGLKYENVDIFYGHWEYLTGIWDLLWPFVTFCVHLVHFFRFWYHVPTKKNLATLALFTYTKKDFFFLSYDNDCKGRYTSFKLSCRVAASDRTNHCLCKNGFIAICLSLT
jgi:hypothetical protein